MGSSISDSSIPVTTGEASSHRGPPADPLLETQAAELYDALQALIRVYQFRDRDRICCYDLSVTQCYALEAVAERGPLTVNEVAATLYLDKSTTSRVLDSLEKKGLMRREANPADKRSWHLRATSKGHELYEKIRRDVESREQKLLADFDPEVRRDMISLISRLARAAAQRVDTTGGCCCCTD